VGLKNVTRHQIRPVTRTGNPSSALQALLKAIAIKSRITIELAGERIPLNVARPKVRTGHDLRSVEYLDLSDTDIADISPLATAKKLKYAVLSRIRNLRSIAALAKLPIEDLYLAGTPVDLRPLLQMRALRFLWVTVESNEDMRIISGLSWLERLLVETSRPEYVNAVLAQSRRKTKYIVVAEKN